MGKEKKQHEAVLHGIHHKRRKSLVVRTICFIFAASFAVIFLFPTVVTIANSFMSQSEISSNYGMVFSTTDSGAKAYISEKVNIKLIPDMVSFSQYFTVLLKSPSYLLKFWNSVILVVPITVFQIIIACLASYGFARTEGKLKGIVFFGYIILMLMPYQVTLVPNYLVAEWFKILNTNWAIWLPGIFSPFSVYLLTKYMKRIPKALFEAAQIDGATHWKILRSIVLPLSKATIAVMVLYYGVEKWNGWFWASALIRDRSKLPLQVILREILLSSTQSMQTGAGSSDTEAIGVTIRYATTIVATVPILCVYPFVQKYFTKGVMIGAVKE